MSKRITFSRYFFHFLIFLLFPSAKQFILTSSKMRPLSASKPYNFLFSLHFKKTFRKFKISIFFCSLLSVVFSGNLFLLFFVCNFISSLNAANDHNKQKILYYYVFYLCECVHAFKYFFFYTFLLLFFVYILFSLVGRAFFLFSNFIFFRIWRI